MQAVVQDTYGTAAVLQSREIPKPQIADNEVLVRVRAAGVNPADWAVMSGLPYIARPVYGLPRPKQPVRGTDVAGVVEAVGAGVTRFKAGDAVFGSSKGSYAEYTIASEDALALKPSNVTFEQAAVVPMAGMVALQAIRDHGNVQPGQKVLINGASGGIGTFAVQIAKSLGAEVTAVCSAGNAELVRSIGADHVIDYTKDDFTRSEERYDFILDNVADHSLADLRRALTPTGTLVPNGGNFGNRWLAGGARVVQAHVVSRFVSQTLRPFLLAPKLDDLVTLRELIDAGKVTPVIDHAYPLSETGQAMAYVGMGHARGKVAITVSYEAPVSHEAPVALSAVA
jgi:NADPH:quinone reductase-like Zn-dependent oxidoreductase